jgi:hypothetical protein
MFPFLAEEITPVRDRGAPVGDGPLKDLLRGCPELDPLITGKTIGFPPRIQAGLVQDLTGIDIPDAGNAALIHEERFYRYGALLSNLPQVRWIECVKGVAS